MKKKYYGVTKHFVFTPDNLINNLDKLGAWTSYGLACIALAHYFPEYKDKEEKNEKDIQFEVELLDLLRCPTWKCAIIKYHTEVGYTIEELSNNEIVNEY